MPDIDSFKEQDTFWLPVEEEVSREPCLNGSVALGPAESQNTVVGVNEEGTHSRWMGRRWETGVLTPPLQGCYDITFSH